MTEKELSITLREMACSQKTPLCAEWTDAWPDDCGIDTLLEKYIKGFDFAVMNNYPTLKFIRENFRKEDLNRHNIYLDDEVRLESVSSGYYIFLGNCKANICIRGFKAVTVYCRHDSDVDVQAFDGARVFVTYYDSSHGECSNDNMSHIRRYDRNG